MFAFLLSLALMAQTPAPARPDADSLRAQRSLDLAREAQRRKLNRMAKNLRARASAQRDAYQSAQQAASEARMAPIWAEQARQAVAQAQAQQRADALSVLAGAARWQADTDARRLRIQARRAGYPQVGPYQSVP